MLREHEKRPKLRQRIGAFVEFWFLAAPALGGFVLYCWLSYAS